MLRRMELGVATFADLSSGVTPEQRMRDLMEEVRLADELGLDVFAIGEHHRPDFLISSPATALAAAAVISKRIRLSSAVTVLSSDDPVRVFQAFAEVDLLSGGRAEIMAGRGSFIESFPLFGYDLHDYDDLFAEKILFEHELFGHQRYVGQMSVGAVEHRDVLRSMELFGTEVAPVVRAEVARRESVTAAGQAA